MSKFIKKEPEIIIPKEVKKFLDDLWDYCDEYDLEFSEFVEGITTLLDDITKSDVIEHTKVTLED